MPTGKPSKAASSPIVSLAFWLDLRGYGAMLNRAGFDPTCADAKTAIDRLTRFQEVVARRSRTTFPTLVINDGAVAYRDIGLTRTDRALPFIERCWDLFKAARDADEEIDGSRRIRTTVSTINIPFSPTDQNQSAD